MPRIPRERNVKGERIERNREREERGREKEKRRREERQSKVRREGRQRERERYGKEEDTWSGQDRRANGGHRTEMASGSAFQYSTLATLGHPTSSAPRLSPSCPLLVLQHPQRLSPSFPHLVLCARTHTRIHIYVYTRSFFLSLLLSFHLFVGSFSCPDRVVLLLCRDLIPLRPKLSILLWT